MRVTEFEDEISALARKHRQLRMGLLIMPVILAGLVVGALGGASEWVWALVGVLVSLPLVLWQSRTQLRTIAEHKEDLLLQLKAVKQEGRLQKPTSHKGDTSKMEFTAKSHGFYEPLVAFLGNHIGVSVGLMAHRAGQRRVIEPGKLGGFAAITVGVNLWYEIHFDPRPAVQRGVAGAH